MPEWYKPRCAHQWHRFIHVEKDGRIVMVCGRTWLAWEMKGKMPFTLEDLGTESRICLDCKSGRIKRSMSDLLAKWKQIKEKGRENG